MKALKKNLQHDLSTKELKNLRASFDMIGDIAILEVPRELTKKQKLIAARVLEQHPNLHVIAKKKGGHAGKYRRQKLQWLAGQKRFETVHKESGVVMRLDVEKCYYSQRMSTERARIAQLIQSGEEVLVLFSGIAPYPLVLAKQSPAKHITAVEMNPVAHKYATENVKLNKLEHKITLLKGNASRIVPKLRQKFDRIIMVLPRSASRYLAHALRVAKPHTFMHVYAFAKENEFEKAGRKVQQICARFKKPCHVLRIVKAGQNAPRQYRVCVDAQVE